MVITRIWSCDPVCTRSIILTLGIGQYHGQGVYCGLSTASKMFLIFTTQVYKHFRVFLFLLVSDEPEVFLPKYSQTAIPHAAHFRRVVEWWSRIILKWRAN